MGIDCTGLDVLKLNIIKLQNIMIQCVNPIHFNTSYIVKRGL